jgi:hypothetical protein
MKSRESIVMTFRLRSALVTVAATFAFSTVAVATDGAAQDEIDHLLKFVGSSSCSFVRNGTEYPADKAREHLAGKYHFAGSRITTADDFIKYLGTGSSMSGEPYRVKCGNADALSATWLGDELARYRKTRLQAAR